MSQTAAVDNSAEIIAPGEAKRGDTVTWLLRAAWMSILLGFVMQVLTAALAKWYGADPDLKPIVRDLAQKVTWATFVCMGLAVGTAAARARAGWVGLVGLLAAPTAFVLARAVQKATAQSIGAAQPEVMGETVFYAMLALKAVEYCGLGALLAWFANQERFGLGAYVGAGAGFGLTFGLLVLAVFYYAPDQPPPQAKLAALAINEILFPIGCSMVLCASNKLGARLRAG